MKTADDIGARMFRAREEWMKELIVRETVGNLNVTARQRIRVTPRKPRWMPAFVYRWLWRTVLLEETPVEVTTRGRGSW